MNIDRAPRRDLWRHARGQTRRVIDPVQMKLSAVLRSLAFAAGFAWCAAPMAQPAPDPFAELSDAEVEVAIGLLDQAEAAEDAGDWEGAIRAYRALSAIVEVPEAQLREAAALAQGGHLVEADALFEHLANGGSAAVAQAAATAQLELRTAHPARVLVRATPAPAWVTVDGGERAVVGVDGLELAVAPGVAHVLVVGADAFAEQRVELTLAVGAEHASEHQLVAAAVAADPEPAVTVPVESGAVVALAPDSGAGSSWAAPVALGVVALGAGGVSAYFGARSLERAEAHNVDPAGDPNETLADQAQSARTMAYTFAGVAGAAAIGSVITAVLHDGAESSARAASFGAAPSRGGVHVNVQLRW